MFRQTQINVHPGLHQDMENNRLVSPGPGGLNPQNRGSRHATLNERFWPEVLYLKAIAWKGGFRGETTAQKLKV